MVRAKKCEMLLHINGEEHFVFARQADTLLFVLRNELRFTGTKPGCLNGDCGACTVLVDGKAVRSCMATADVVDGKKVTTIEGLSKNGMMHPVQQAFIDQDALQCGYCTPGMIMTACSFLTDHPDPTRQEIIEAMNENLCRCGAHKRMISAIETAAKEMKGGKNL